MLRLLICLLILPINVAFAGGADFGENTSIVTSFKKANATCFLYENNEYKCACSQLKSRKRDIWSSKPMSFFEGKLSVGTQYIYAERCK